VFPHPNIEPAKTVGKIGYVVRYAPWEWILATDAYVDDIDDAFMKSLYTAGGVFIATALLLAALTSTINHGIARILGGDPDYAAPVADAIASGNLDLSIETRAGDTRSLVRAMERMRSALTHTIGQIKSATHNDQINLAITQMDSVTQQNAALVEQAAAAAQSLEDQSRELQAAVAIFQVQGR